MFVCVVFIDILHPMAILLGRFFVYTLTACAVVGVFFSVGMFVAFGEETKDEHRARLELELRGIEGEIAQQQQLVEAKQGERQTLERDVTILNAKIKKAQLGLKARTIDIQRLGTAIGDKQIVINELSARLDRQKQSVGQLIRKTHELDDFNFVEVMLGNQNLSTFFEDVDRFQVIKESLRKSYNDLAEIKGMTSEQKNSLEDKQSTAVELKKLQELEKLEIEKNETQKAKILKITKGQESAYQVILKQKQKTAAQIRRALFELRGTSGIPFGTAVQFAETASKKTGVRAALILAILSQESDLGKNVGQCLVTDITTGDGKGKNTGTSFPGTMKAPRDTVPFDRITKALGLDWSTTPISCPAPGGYGGAMGPTQFLPSTWEGYESRIQSALGITATNPWDAQQAIVTTALYLQDQGAVGGSYPVEHTSAARYYAGGNWQGAPGQGYANQVMQKAASFQNNIDIIEEK